MENKDYKLMANAIRVLTMDAVQRANSGHPGMPMGMADVATILYSEFLKFNPVDPNWVDRDRFILSAGHGSMLLYALLYLIGDPEITIEDLKNFRQLGSKTAGHPEVELLSAVETTTGPLGQGLANAVGMAMAEKILNEKYGSKSFNHNTYVVVGDGCLMEGISQEAISLAGHLKLNKLVVLFDDNKISIDGPTSLTISEDTIARFKASGWNATSIDGHNYEQIRSALTAAKASDKPSFIACSTIIGYGSPNKQGTEHCHGAALGELEVAKVRENLNCPDEEFIIPENILKNWREVGLKSIEEYKLWQENNISIEFNCDLPNNWQQSIIKLKEEFLNSDKMMSTRKASSLVLAALAKDIPQLIGGSADLTGSNLTKPSDFEAINANNFSGRYIYYGVREHAMCAIMNGLALHENFIPYAGTFLVFTDYCRPAIRLSALMQLQVFYVMTHDSIGLGEDGPTHQPVEHLSSLRAIPNLYVFRPASALETLECYKIAMSIRHSPSLFSLTRQDVLALNDFNCQVEKGAYIISPHRGELKVTIFATGSEVAIAIDAQKELHQKNIGTRVVSIPCFEIFGEQSEEYKAELLDNYSIKVAIEAGLRQCWDQYIGRDGIFIGMNSFGASAPADKLYEHFGITKENIVKRVLSRMEVGCYPCP
ncbi:MAG: transketolase [Rickettsiales bacterium]